MVAVVAVTGTASLWRGKTGVRDNAGLCADKHCEKGLHRCGLSTIALEWVEVKMEEASDAVQCRGKVSRLEADAVWKLQNSELV